MRERLKVRAVVFHAPGDIRVEETEVSLPGPGEILVRMTACGICGSDLMDWYMVQKAPVVMGHEPVGVVEAVGASLDQADPPLPKVGQRVFVHHHAPCLVCRHCRRGRETLCETFAASRLLPGGMAEMIRVPARNAGTDVLVLPDHVDDAAATLIEPLACCVRSQRRAGIDRSTRVAVVGLGQMGLLQVQTALASGCDMLVGVDPLAGRRTQVEAYGARTAEPDAGKVLAALGARPDVVLLATGNPAAVELALDVVAPGGCVQLFAPAPPGHRLPVDLNLLFFREIRIDASYSAGPADTREALDLLACGRVTIEGVITDRYPLSQATAAFAKARSAGSRKVLVYAEAT